MSRHETFAAASSARHEALKQRWAEARQNTDDESAESFWASFGDERDALAAKIQAVRSSNAEPPAKLEGVPSLEASAQALSARVTTAAAWLSAFDVKRAAREADAIEKEVAELKAALAPRKKFGFRKKLVCKKSEAAPALPPAAAPVFDRPGFSKRTGECLVWDSDSELHLDGLVDCVVLAPVALSALRIRDVTNCDIVCAGIDGPAYVQGASRSRIRLVARQLRIHDSEYDDFYVDVASGPVIEDCDHLRFASYNATWKDVDVAVPGVTHDAWRQVNDFKWLKATPSPHWSLLPPAEYQTRLDDIGLSDATRLGLVLM